MISKKHWRSVMDVSHMSLVTRKPVFGACDQSRLKLACSASEASQRLEILDVAIKGIILSKQRTTKLLIRLRDWSAPLLFAYGKTGFLMTWLIYEKEHINLSVHVHCVFFDGWLCQSVLQIEQVNSEDDNWWWSIGCGFALQVNLADSLGFIVVCSLFDKATPLCAHCLVHSVASTLVVCWNPLEKLLGHPYSVSSGHLVALIRTYYEEKCGQKW